MKVKRHKQAKKQLNLYKNVFGLREPYQVFVDGTFCHAAIKTRIHIKEAIEKLFSNSTIAVFTSPCVVEELRKLGMYIQLLGQTSKILDFFHQYLLTDYLPTTQSLHIHS